jgi:flagellar M-ring protein FliF
MVYQYMPLIKYALIGLGMLATYFFLIRPVIKNMKNEVKQHYKTVEQLQYEQRLMLEEEPVEPPLPIDEAITALRKEVRQNQAPTAFIIKNWIQEG